LREGTNRQTTKSPLSIQIGSLYERQYPLKRDGNLVTIAHLGEINGKVLSREYWKDGMGSLVVLLLAEQGGDGAC
jgi:hypothetical protein